MLWKRLIFNFLSIGKRRNLTRSYKRTWINCKKRSVYKRWVRGISVWYISSWLRYCQVEMTDNLLSVAIHSQHPIGLQWLRRFAINTLRIIVLWQCIMPSREQQISDNTVVLYQIPGSFSDTTDVELRKGKNDLYRDWYRCTYRDCYLG